MAFQLSPGVNVTEIDLTTVVPAVGTTEGAFVGYFNWGPVNEIVNISNEIELVDRFSKPSANTYESFFTAANFLSYARNLKVVRAANNLAILNATGNSQPGVLISNENDYSQNVYITTALSAATQFAAKYPGVLGNSLKVDVIANSSNALSVYTYGNLYQGMVNTSTYVAGVGGSRDEMHVTVIDKDGLFTGTANTVLETFAYLSKASDAKTDDGSSNYYVDVLKDRSKYIYATGRGAATWGNPASLYNFGANGDVTTSLSNGALDGPTATNGSLTQAWDKFKNSDEIDVSFLITGNVSATVQQYVIDNIAEVRKDALAFVSADRSDVVNVIGQEVTKLTTWRNTTLNRSTSYAVADSAWKYQFDKYNNTYRWVPLNGDLAGLCVRTDFERDPWFSPAGFNRGQIKNAVKISWSPTKANRDDLYKIGINPVVSFAGEGVILYGDKTLLTKPSAFDRINVRRLFIVLEKAIARAAKYSLFEFNDEFTRAQFISLVEPFLRDVKGRRGIFDFRVVCDTTNNTPEVIDRNEFIGDIYIKPARSINFIQLNFVAVRTGVAFEEIVGKF